MAETVELVVEPRDGRGSAAARKLRRDKKIPGVLYGHKEETVSVSLPAEEFQMALRHGVRVLDLKLKGPPRRRSSRRSSSITWARRSCTSISPASPSTIAFRSTCVSS
jgi:ribosomal protein L25 (general stress protein Ctc)